MKIILITVLLFTSATLVSAQNKRDSLSGSLQRNNEIKLNILYLLVGSPELTYERILGDRNAVGISAFARVTELIKSDFSFQIAPYFRRYFGSRKASGFFLEGSTSITGYDNISSRGNFINEPSPGQGFQLYPEKETFIGVGAALGAKFLTRKGFTGEIYLGASKSLSDVVDFFPRAGLTLGKRF